MAQHETAGEARLGDYVVDDRYGNRGRVYEIRETCPETKAWQRAQIGFGNITEGQIRGERWVCVLVNPAGAVTLPISQARVVEPFEFENPYAGQYFRD